MRSATHYGVFRASLYLLCQVGLGQLMSLLRCVRLQRVFELKLKAIAVSRLKSTVSHRNILLPHLLLRSVFGGIANDLWREVGVSSLLIKVSLAT